VDHSWAEPSPAAPWIGRRCRAESWQLRAGGRRDSEQVTARVCTCSNVITNGASAMKTRIFSVLWLVAVQIAERGIPCSWPDALALLVLVLRAWTTSPCTAITPCGPRRCRQDGGSGRARRAVGTSVGKGDSAAISAAAEPGRRVAHACGSRPGRRPAAERGHRARRSLRRPGCSRWRARRRVDQRGEDLELGEPVNASPASTSGTGPRTRRTPPTRPRRGELLAVACASPASTSGARTASSASARTRPRRGELLGQRPRHGTSEPRGTELQYPGVTPAKALGLRRAADRRILPVS
jgi:hypothetical protein